jgi:hypothetical protein
VETYVEKYMFMMCGHTHPHTYGIDRIHIDSVCCLSASNKKMQSHDENFKAKLKLIRHRLDRIRRRQAEHFRHFRRLNKWNINFKAIINVLNTISVTSLVLTFSGSHTTLILCTVSNSLSAVGTAILTVVNMDALSQSHQTSYLQFAEVHDDYIAELLVNDLNGQDLDRILTEINSKVGLILDNCEPIDLSSSLGTKSPSSSSLHLCPEHPASIVDIKETDVLKIDPVYSLDVLTSIRLDEPQNSFGVEGISPNISSPC